VGLADESTARQEGTLERSAARAEDEFVPMSLLDRDVRPIRDGVRVLDLAATSRRIALLRVGHIEIRPLIYDLPRPAAIRRTGSEDFDADIAPEPSSRRAPA
jgi:hypothetical protein